MKPGEKEKTNMCRERLNRNPSLNKLGSQGSYQSLNPSPAPNSNCAANSNFIIKKGHNAKAGSLEKNSLQQFQQIYQQYITNGKSQESLQPNSAVPNTRYKNKFSQSHQFSSMFNSGVKTNKQ